MLDTVWKRYDFLGKNVEKLFHYHHRCYMWTRGNFLCFVLLLDQWQSKQHLIFPDIIWCLLFGMCSLNLNQCLFLLCSGLKWHLGLLPLLVWGLHVCQLQEDSVWRAYLQMWRWTLWGEQEHQHTLYILWRKFYSKTKFCFLFWQWFFPYLSKQHP